MGRGSVGIPHCPIVPTLYADSIYLTHLPGDVRSTVAKIVCPWISFAELGVDPINELEAAKRHAAAVVSRTGGVTPYIVWGINVGSVGPWVAVGVSRHWRDHKRRTDSH